MAQAAEARSETSMQPSHRVSFEEVAWTDVRDPGCYIEVGSGNLFRIPQEALVRGMSPIITMESRGASRLLKLTDDPFEITPKLRILAAQQGVKPNF
jgi:hypothetical protein